MEKKLQTSIIESINKSYARAQQLVEQNSDVLLNAAMSLMQSTKAAYMEVRGLTAEDPTPSPDYHWLFKTTGVELEFDENGQLCFDYKCANIEAEDDLLHTIPVTASLLTEAGRKEVVARWKKAEAAQWSGQAAAEHSKRLARIATLRTELTALEAAA